MWLKRLGVFAAVGAAVLLLGVESVYRWGLLRVGELPRLPTVRARLMPVHRALWAAEEGGPMVVRPRMAWDVVAELGHSFLFPARSDRLGFSRSPGARISDSIAWNWLRNRTGPRRAWPEISLGIWLTRHASAEQLVVRWADTASYGRGGALAATAVGGFSCASSDTDAPEREPIRIGPHRGLVGVEAAAREYFGLAPDALDWAQSALIAGLPQAPSAYDPRRHPERALARRARVLTMLLEQGLVTSKALAVSRTAPLGVSSAEGCPSPDEPR